MRILIIGRVEGFFEVKQTSIGIQPSGGYIQKFDIDWLYPAGMRTLRISFRTSDCGLDIGLIKLVNRAGEAHFEEIRNPLTHFYTYKDYTVKINRQSKISPGVIGNFDVKCGERYCQQMLDGHRVSYNKKWQQCLAQSFLRRR